MSEVFIVAILQRSTVAIDTLTKHTGNMKSDHRYRLRYGSYTTPRLRYGATVSDAGRGDVVIVAISNGRIPWPLGRVPGNSNRALILYGGLVRALRRESASAVAYWWGVTAQTISKWRKALGVTRPTKGERELRAEHGRRNWQKVGPKLLSKAHDPERAAKIAAAKLGKPRAPSTVEKTRRANIGRKLSAATRLKMSAVHRRRGTRPPWLKPAWSAAEDALLTKLPPAEVAKRTGRTIDAVCQRRRKIARVQ